MTPQPIFIFCLPRSGSTLLQRVLASYPEVSTTSEPWLLLPFLYTLRTRSEASAYPHQENVLALNEFFAQMPRGSDDYREALRKFVLDVYARAADDGATYFLDKTPIYHLIVDEVIELFPDAKHIFLFRNPLSVAVSLTETFTVGRWKPQEFRADLYNGLDNLLAAQERHRDRSVAVQYERLVTGDDAEWVRLAEHLGLDFDARTLERFGDVRIEGSFKDPTGTQLYSGLSTQPLDKWKGAIRNPLRKWWCETYLRWVGRERMEQMGYDLDATLAELEAIPVGRDRLTKDSIDVVRSVAHRHMRAYLFPKTKSVSAWRYLFHESDGAGRTNGALSAADHARGRAAR